MVTTVLDGLAFLRTHNYTSWKAGFMCSHKYNQNCTFFMRSQKYLLFGMKGVRSKMKVFSSQQLGQAIRKRRKELGYTQTKLAEFSGCGLTFISTLEHGKKTVELEKVLQVINTLGVDLLFEQRGCYEIVRKPHG